MRAAKAVAKGVLPLAVGPNMVIICCISSAKIAKKSHSAKQNGYKLSIVNYQLSII
jgi:hypothetical protein